MHDIRPFIRRPFTEPGSLLYVGARADAHSWLDELIEAGHQITILEVWPENAYNLNPSKLFSIVVNDVRNIDHAIPEQPSYDYIFWWHGPEHLELPEIEPTLQKLESKCNRLIALACPYGLYPQDAAYGNPYERHLATLYPAFFQVMGYNIRADGEPDQPGSEIVAWKVLG